MIKEVMAEAFPGKSGVALVQYETVT